MSADCTCAGSAPGYPQHEHYCGQPKPCEVGPHDTLWTVHIHDTDGLVYFDTRDEARAYEDAALDLADMFAHVISPRDETR